MICMQTHTYDFLYFEGHLQKKLRLRNSLKNDMFFTKEIFSRIAPLHYSCYAKIKKYIFLTQMCLFDQKKRKFRLSKIVKYNRLQIC